jgi:hypothetical protein
MSARDALLTAAAILFGALVWIGVARVSGRTEAWDSGLYLYVAMPAVCLFAFALGYMAPAHAWRWGVAPVVGQLLWLLASSSSWGLLPLGLIAFCIIAVPSVVAARIGAALRRRGPRSN